MIVKNEDRFVWFAIQSLLPFVDQFLIYDTGSSDATQNVIRQIVHKKIYYKQYALSNPAELTNVRFKQLKQTQTDWLWMIDGDEIYPQKTVDEVKHILVSQPELEGIILRRYDLLGDIYHYQPNPKVGGYQLWDQLGHFNLRLINCHIPGLHLSGDYPNEGFVDSFNQPIISHSKNHFAFTTNHYWHATYLQRSSLGGNLSNTLHRQKFKIEWGKTLSRASIPQVFFDKNRPDFIPDPTIHRSHWYNLKAAAITPFKMIKRGV